MKNVINEGLFVIPREVYKDILDWIIDSYKKFEKNGKSLNGLETRKMFEIDLKGTRFAFLNSENRKVRIHLIDSKTKVLGYFWSYDTEKDFNTFPKKYANIYINFSYGLLRITDYTLEHEILHLIQELIKLNKKTKKLGGLPPRKYVDLSIDDEGYIIKSKDKRIKRRRRVEHSKRPVELYTNLNTLLRNLQRAYLEYLKKIPDKKDTIELRKLFFIKKHEQAKNNIEDIGFELFSNWTPIIRIAKTYKSAKNIYHHYMKLLYKSFVNKEQEIDLDVFEDVSNISK